MRLKSLRIPVIHEPNIPNDYTEHGVEKGAKVSGKEIEDEDMSRIFTSTMSFSLKECFEWMEGHKKEFMPSTIIVDSDDGNEILSYKNIHPKVIIQKKPLNRIRHLNTLLNRTNEVLDSNGYLWCHCRTASLKRKLIKEKYPWGIWHIVFVFYFIWHRIIPKLNITKSIYFAISKGKDRSYNRVEVLGRFYRAGFEVIDEEFRHGEFFVLAQKAKEPIWDDVPSGSPLIKLMRVGKGGKMIGVYKFRTMYSYSEYLQPYIYEHNKLKKGGKFDDDYRVTPWGKWMRRLWIDELPMLFNVLKGDIKLVGVRPLSRHFYSLYHKDIQQLRIKSKPGLLPPAIAERKRPVNLDEIQESERRYLESYLEKPFNTDITYFFKILNNILFKGRRSE